MLAPTASSDPWGKYVRSSPDHVYAVDAPRARGGPEGGDSFRRATREPEKIDWNGEFIVPVTKDFLAEHPAVERRSEHECERIRTRHSVNILRRPDYEQVPKPIESFEELCFPDWAVSELRRQGFKAPLPVQVQAWPIASHGHDLVAIAETGSGKTLSYVLPMLVHICAQPELRPGEGPVGLVLLPTHDLCLQVADRIAPFAALCRLACQAIHGGSGHREREAQRAKQEQELLGRCDIVVATPGRLNELLRAGKTNLRRATFLVLDEADELLSEGFSEQVKLLISQVRPDRQVLLFSATWTEEMELLSQEAVHVRPIHICVGAEGLKACKDIEHAFWPTAAGGDSKADLLRKAMTVIRSQLPQGTKALVFVNQRDDVQGVADEVRALGVRAEPFMSYISQAERDDVLSRFSRVGGDVDVIVTTQVLGRGLDVRAIRYVVNYDMPRKMVEYVHRVGRTGRAGENGFAVTFLEPADLVCARDLLELLKQSGKEEAPQILREAASKKMRNHYRNLWHERRAGKCLTDKEPAIAARETEAHHWNGRGRCRRSMFLAQCQERGAAREHAT